MHNSHKIVLPILLTLTLIIMSSSLSFAEVQAVSAINANMGISGGTVDSDSSSVFFMSTSIPVPDGVGIQFDTLGSDQDDIDISGFGTQLFRRDPEFGFFGIKTSYLKTESTEFFLAGLQGGLYKGMTTLSWEIGGQWGDIDSDVYTRLNARYYFFDNFSVELGVGHAFDETYGRASIEWQAPPLPNKFMGLSLFMDASGGNHTGQILAGFKIYFGESKSLIRRHREDNLPNTLKDSLSGISRYKKRL